MIIVPCVIFANSCLNRNLTHQGTVAGDLLSYIQNLKFDAFDVTQECANENIMAMISGVVTATDTDSLLLNWLLVDRNGTELS